MIVLGEFPEFRAGPSGAAVWRVCVLSYPSSRAGRPCLRSVQFCSRSEEPIFVQGRECRKLPGRFRRSPASRSRSNLLGHYRPSGPQRSAHYSGNQLFFILQLDQDQGKGKTKYSLYSSVHRRILSLSAPKMNSGWLHKLVRNSSAFGLNCFALSMNMVEGVIMSAKVHAKKIFPPNYCHALKPHKL